MLGIRSNLDAPGFKHFTIKPEMIPEVTRARGHYDSIRGRIVSDWELENDKITLRVEIPGNTTATVWVPADEAAAVTESGMPAAQAVTFLRMALRI